VASAKPAICDHPSQTFYTHLGVVAEKSLAVNLKLRDVADKATPEVGLDFSQEMLIFGSLTEDFFPCISKCIHTFRFFFCNWQVERIVHAVRSLYITWNLLLKNYNYTRQATYIFKSSWLHFRKNERRSFFARTSTETVSFSYYYLVKEKISLVLYHKIIPREWKRERTGLFPCPHTKSFGWNDCEDYMGYCSKTITVFIRL